MAKKNMDDVKQLIDIGKEKGFLTFDEVNDILPPDIATDQIEDVMGMLDQMESTMVNTILPSMTINPLFESTQCLAEGVG